mmetsp:Transcript_77321/g.244303  ORF Transcript_77321/g.244303 Transcript_77321/m.244303 type:complete len:346 (+) Transcript_77321:64-1101(+)
MHLPRKQEGANRTRALWETATPYGANALLAHLCALVAHPCPARRLSMPTDALQMPVKRRLARHGMIPSPLLKCRQRGDLLCSRTPTSTPSAQAHCRRHHQRPCSAFPAPCADAAASCAACTAACAFWAVSRASFSLPRQSLNLGKNLSESALTSPKARPKTRSTAPSTLAFTFALTCFSSAEMAPFTAPQIRGPCERAIATICCSRASATCASAGSTYGRSSVCGDRPWSPEVLTAAGSHAPRSFLATASEAPGPSLRSVWDAVGPEESCAVRKTCSSARAMFTRKTSATGSSTATRLNRVASVATLPTAVAPASSWSCSGTSRLASATSSSIRASQPSRDCFKS